MSAESAQDRHVNADHNCPSRGDLSGPQVTPGSPLTPQEQSEGQLPEGRFLERPLRLGQVEGFSLPWPTGPSLGIWTKQGGHPKNAPLVCSPFFTPLLLHILLEQGHDLRLSVPTE
ncbi:uncharacterized protein LOC144291719 isoform X2 [Canis aureus]